MSAVISGFTVGTNSTLRFSSSIRSNVRLALVESRLAIRTGEWVELGVALKWLGNAVATCDTGDAFTAPADRGAYPAYIERCEHFISLGRSVELPPLPERQTLVAQLKDVEAAMAQGELDSVVLRGLVAYLREKDSVICRRIESTVPASWLQDVARVVLKAAQEYTGVEQPTKLPAIPPPTTRFLRLLGARE